MPPSSILRETLAWSCTSRYAGADAEKHRKAPVQDLLTPNTCIFVRLDISDDDEELRGAAEARFRRTGRCAGGDEVEKTFNTKSYFPFSVGRRSGRPLPPEHGHCIWDG